MAKDYFVVSKGLGIDSSVVLLYGSADPSAGGGVAAPISSIYCRTSDGSTWHKTGSGDTEWLMFLDSSGASVEDTYQNLFMGKSSTGSVLPSFTEQNHVTDDDDLMTSIDNLDMYLGANPTPNTRTVGPIVGANDVNANIEALDDAIGSDSDFGVALNVSTSNSIYANLAAIDIALTNKNPFQISAVNQTFSSTGLLTDQVAVASYATSEWLLTVKSTSTGANRAVYKVVAVNDGSTNVDYTLYSILTVGSAISGLDVTVDIDSGNMRLLVASTENIDYTIDRIAHA